MFTQAKHIHFIGMGGSGISSLAFLALAQRKSVTGSDVSDSSLLETFRRQGAKVHVGHQGKNLPNMVNLVIYSEAIDKSANPEYKLAQEWGVPILSYFEALGELSQSKKTLVVSGSHGKTTTTGMLGVALVRAGFDPTVILGSQLQEFDGRNIYIGKGDWLVVEGCEYRRSFLHLQPYGVIVLNCETDHHDYYQDDEDYVRAFQELVAKVPEEGFVVANSQDPNAKRIAEGFKGKKILIERADVERLDLHLKIMGEFNEWNAAHAYKAAKLAGANTDLVRRALLEFKGAGRRTEIKGEMNGGVTIVDDYGHHPTEVRLTLHAVREKFPGRRLICVFQPHQYRRTKQFLNEFSGIFKEADLVIVPNIYAARDSEAIKKQISAKELVDRIAEQHSMAIYGENFEKTEALVRQEARPGDVVLVMGAGDVGFLAEKLVR